MERDEPLFSVADLSRRITTSGEAQEAVRAVFGERRVSRTFPGD
jgi:hypothetical protein